MALTIQFKFVPTHYTKVSYETRSTNNVLEPFPNIYLSYKP